MTRYLIPEKANAATWFPEESKLTSGAATIKDISYMQEMNKTVCTNSRNITDTVELEDVRDGNKYKVKVLADGKCWMINNLELDLSVIGIAAADASDHLSEDYPTEGLVDRWNTPTGNAWVNNNAQDEFSKAPAKKNGTGSLQPDSGYFYSWCAATAKTCDSVTTAESEATGSICPKGWRLPSSKAGTGVNDFAIVVGLAGVNITTATNYWDALNNIGQISISGNTLTVNGSTWLAAGSVNADGLYAGGTGGYYWSRTADSATSARRLGFSPNNITLANSGVRYSGYSIRCVADESVLTSQHITDRFAHTESVTGAVTVSVANTISIDAVSGTGNIDVDTTKIGIGTISATIISNTTYRVMLSAAKTSLTSSNPANTAEIPTSDNVVRGTSAWGIQNSDGVTYTAITTEAHEYAHTHTENDNGDLGKTHLFTVGISVSPTLPADNYSTDVTITAGSF